MTITNGLTLGLKLGIVGVLGDDGDEEEGDAGGEEGGDGGDSGLTLDGIEESTCFDCDVTLPEGYTGTTLFNKVTSPNDGASQSDYDLTASNMTLSGDTGTSAATLTHSGTGYLQILNPTGQFINHIARSGTSGWLAMAWKTNDSTGNLFLFDTRNSVTDAGLGVAIRKRGSETFQFIINNSGGLVQSATTTNIMPLDTRTLSIVSWNGTNTRFWINDTPAAEVENLTFWTDTTTSCNEAFNVFQSYVGSNKGDATTELIGVYGGNAFLDNTSAGNIAEFLGTRHEEIYF